MLRTLLFGDSIENDGQTADIRAEDSDESGNRGLHCSEDLGDKSFLARELGKSFNSGDIKSLTLNKACLYLIGLESLVVLDKLADDSCRSNVVIRTESDGGSTFEYVFQTFDTGLFERSLEEGILNYGILNARFSEIAAELCIVSYVDALIGDENARYRVFQLVG